MAKGTDMGANSTVEPGNGQPDGATADQDAGVPRPSRPLPPAALRALAEAEERRRAAGPRTQATELQGRGGAEPVRYGDWEVKGLATDF